MNVSITFYLYLGNHTVGHWLPGQDDSLRIPHPDETPFNWLYSLEDFLTKIVPKLERKPTIFILNSGFWPNKFQSDMDFLDRIANYSVANFDTTIWKTTNYNQNHDVGVRTVDDRWLLKTQEFPTLLLHDLAWTLNVGAEHYWDLYHFRAAVYWRITAELIALLQSVSAGKL